MKDGKVYRVVTNNPDAVTTAAAAGCEKEWINGTASAVLDRAAELLLTDGWRLAADLMGGRRARAFPYLTVILEGVQNSETAAETADFQRLLDYRLLDAGRRAVYEAYDASLQEDFRCLDLALTRTALGRLLQS